MAGVRRHRGDTSATTTMEYDRRVQLCIKGIRKLGQAVQEKREEELEAHTARIEQLAQELENERMELEETHQRLHEAEEEATKLTLQLEEGKRRIDSEGFYFIIARLAEVVAISAMCVVAVWTSRRDLYTQV